MGVGVESFVKLVKSNNLECIGKRSVKDYLKRPKFELYDLENDSDEINNLANLDEYKALTAFYKKRIYRFQQETGDIWKIYQDYEIVDVLIK